VLLASSSLAALLIGGGATPGVAACITQNGGTVAAVTNSAAATCINITGNATVTGNVTNTGTITATGSTPPTETGITVKNASIGGAIINAGSIIAPGFGSGITVTIASGAVTNSGTISAEIFGIIVASSPSFAGGISNAGNISGAVTGIIVLNSQSYAGGISNGSAGTITASQEGIYVGTTSTFTGNLSNAGTITANTGIGVSYATIAGAIIDSGNIEGSNHGIAIDSNSKIAGAATAIAVTGPTFTGGISNAGSIAAQSVGIMVASQTFTGGITNAGAISVGHSAFGISVTAQTFTGGISNSGHITAGLSGIGVGGSGVSTFAGGITNSGTIASTGTRNGVGVLSITQFTGGIGNSGVITAGGIGIAVATVSVFGSTSASGGITNSTGGTISAGIGISVANGTQFYGDIVNNGTIVANVGLGITVQGISSFSGGITNTGAISAVNTAIAVTGFVTFANGITNSGTISSQTNGRAGIFVSGSAFSGGIGNSGTISSAGYGIAVAAITSFAGGISNSSSGTIIARAGSDLYVANVATFADGISNAGTITGSAGIYAHIVSAFSAGIGNSGTIAANTYGIYANNNSTFAGGISNSGTISAGYYGIIVGRDARTNGAVSNPTFSGGISNTGTISAAHTGIYVNNVSSFSGNIGNAGTITGAAAAIGIGAGVTFAGGAAIVNSGILTGTGGTAIDTSNATSAVTIDQTAGTINGAIKLSANADVVNISGGNIAGNIVGQGASDTITFNPGSGNTFTYGSAYSFSSINQVNVNSGTVVLNGADAATNVDVFGGTLAGTGSIDPTTVTIHSGGTFAPGNGTPGTSMTITGNLVLQSGATYQVYVNPGTSSFATVSGAASLAGTVNASFANGSYISKVYTILTAGSVTGTFSGLTTVNLPSNFTTSLSYDSAHAYLDLTLDYTAPRYAALNINQNNVANALINYFDTDGRIPTALGTLNPSGLSQVGGEDATGAQRGAFRLMTDFLELMLDPTAGGGSSSGGGSASSFAPEQDASLPPDIADVYAEALGQPPQAQEDTPQPASQMPLSLAPPSLAPQSFDQRWSAWGSAFGGASWSSGNAAIGSSNVTTNDYGYGAGMEYHAAPDAVLGFGLAGGGTNWNLVQGLGAGRSDAFLAGVYAKTHLGPAYLSTAFAFANHWFTTDRTALSDQLRGSFMGQDFAARFEGGYRYAVPVQDAIIGVTPYAALQRQDFQTASYSENDPTGGGFGLSYGSANATDTRSELGARFDNLQIVDSMPLVLRGRLAWAHDWVSNPALGAVFQALPGSNFTVNGAAPPKDSALATAAAELHISANWTAIARFDGAYGAGSQTYGGTGTLKYSW
jgi:uncharacterized protein with beta-barrel porin domain